MLGEAGCAAGSGPERGHALLLQLCVQTQKESKNAIILGCKEITGPQNKFKLFSSKECIRGRILIWKERLDYFKGAKKAPFR